MPPKPAAAPSRRNFGMDPLVVLGLGAALVFFAVTGGVAYLNITMLREDNQKIIHSDAVISALDELLSTAKDAETGQRGFLLTGEPKYLDPYNAAKSAIVAKIDAVAELTQDNPTQQARIAPLKRHLDAKTAELQETDRPAQHQGRGGGARRCRHRPRQSGDGRDSRRNRRDGPGGRRSPRSARGRDGRRLQVGGADQRAFRLARHRSHLHRRLPDPPHRPHSPAPGMAANRPGRPVLGDARRPGAGTTRRQHPGFPGALSRRSCRRGLRRRRR